MIKNVPSGALTSAVLHQIANKMESLERIGVDVLSFRYAGVEVHLQWRDDQMDGRTMWVTSIERAVGSGGTLRSNEPPSGG